MGFHWLAQYIRRIVISWATNPKKKQYEFSLHRAPNRYMLNTRTEQADWAVLFVHSPGQEPEPVGVFLLDLRHHMLYFKLKETLQSNDLTVLEVWKEMAADLKQRIADYGGIEVFDWFATTATNVLQLAARERISIADRDPQAVLEQLYLNEVQK